MSIVEDFDLIQHRDQKRELKGEFLFF